MHHGNGSTLGSTTLTVSMTALVGELFFFGVWAVSLTPSSLSADAVSVGERTISPDIIERFGDAGGVTDGCAADSDGGISCCWWGWL